MTDTPVNPVHAPIVAQRDAFLAQIATLDVQLSAIAGTLSAKTKRITEDLLAAAPDHLAYDSNGSVDLKVQSVFSTIDDMATNSPVTARTFVDSLIADLKDVREGLDTQVKALVNAQLKATSATSDEATTLKTARAALVTQADAFNTVLAQMGGTPVDVPSAPRVGGGGGGGTRGVKVSDVEYYRLVNGEQVFYSAGRDLSLIAFHAGVTVSELEAILLASGVEDIAKDFSATVTVIATKGKKMGKEATLTIGCNVTKKD